MTTNSKPRCPNHDVELTQCGFPIPKRGQGVCPVSGASFDFEIDVAESTTALKLNAKGEIIKTTQWKITGND